MRKRLLQLRIKFLKKKLKRLENKLKNFDTNSSKKNCIYNYKEKKTMSSKFYGKTYGGYKVTKVTPAKGGHALFTLTSLRNSKRKVTVRDNFMTKLSRKEVRVSDIL